MTPEARKAYNEYMRKWRKEHPTKNREYKARYWENQAKKLATLEEPLKNGESDQEATA